MNALGAVHVDCAVDQIVADETHKIVSTPLLGPWIADVGTGIEKLVSPCSRWPDGVLRAGLPAARG